MSLFYPVQSDARITSYYGTREAPNDKASTDHKGLDFGVGEGSSVFASDSGYVMQIGYNDLSGNYIIIDNGNGYQYGYKHLQKSLVNQGDNVKAGQIIALSGNTGNTTGAHLHFEVRKDGSYIDPMSILKNAKDARQVLSNGSEAAAAKTPILDLINKYWLPLLIGLVFIAVFVGYDKAKDNAGI